MNKLLTLTIALAITSIASAAPYFGTSVGYLVDGEEAFFTVRAGHQVATTSALKHAVEFEVGYTADRESYSGVRVRNNIVPLMVNYRATSNLTQRIGFYFGGGLGISRVKLTARGSGFATFRDSDTTFSAQGFGGANFQINKVAALTLGARYLWIDDVRFLGVTSEIGDDVVIEAGVSFGF